MKITILIGSPKGELSVTLQSMLYVQKKMKEINYEILHIGSSINKIENNSSFFEDIISKIEKSDGIIWAFPVYCSNIPAQLLRFFELVFERNRSNVFYGKYVSAYMTSIKVGDSRAEDIITALSNDLGMKFVESLSHDMEDFLKEQERGNLIHFAENLIEAIENKIPIPLLFPKEKQHEFQFTDKILKEPKIDTGSKRIVIITDSVEKNSNLGKMVNYFKNSFSNPVEIIDISTYDIKGGCKGCLQCLELHNCSYNDSFKDLFESKIDKSDMVIIAGNYKNRYLSTKWKIFFDRSFFNGLCPLFSNKQVGIIISGPFKEGFYLKTFLKGYFEIHQANIAGILTDECEDSEVICKLLYNMANNIYKFSNANYMKPKSFEGVGASKIFRDDTWGRFRIAHPADHIFYGKNRLYDFPQYNIKIRIMNFLIPFLYRIPNFKKKLFKNILAEVIKPHKKVIDSTQDNSQTR